jgi:hypothetical protein
MLERLISQEDKMNHINRLQGLVFIAVLFGLTACASLAPTPTPTPLPTATRVPENTPTRQPVIATQVIPSATPVSVATRQPAAPVVANTPSASATQPSLAPASGDDKLQRGNVFLDTSRIISTTSLPPQFSLELIGSLPTPCHQLRAQVASPNAQNQIRVSVYSLVDSTMMCMQMIAPFNATASLGNWVKGSYSVWVNDKQIGQVTMP